MFVGMEKGRKYVGFGPLLTIISDCQLPIASDQTWNLGPKGSEDPCCDPSPLIQL
jgi:hypothetical protein